MHTTLKQLHCAPHLRIYYLKEDTSLPAMFNQLFSSTNQQLFKKNFCNSKKPLRMISITNGSHHVQSTLFVVNKDEWDTKEGRGKSMKNVQRYGKRHLSG